MYSETIITVSIYIFIITSMLFIGLGHTWRDILAPFKNVKLVLFALLVNLILIPVAGYLIATVFALSGAMIVGFLLMTSAPGASYSPRIAEIAEGNVPFSTGLMFLLSSVALVSAPITILLLLPEGSSVSVLPVIRTLLLLMFIPMVIGLLIRARWPKVAEKLMSPVVWTSYIMILVVFVVFLLYKIFSPDPVGGLRDLFGTMGILAIILAVGISLILGYLFGGPAEGTRRSLAFGSANRNAGMALLFATSISSELGDILAVLVTYIIVQIIMSAVIAAKWRKKPASGSGKKPSGSL
ncbi:MAG: bile acid:sodium symporter [Methanoregulaceae archaeon]|nr:bile acid:sodium symporter [Methanoregulaceae archaeon]